MDHGSDIRTLSSISLPDHVESNALAVQLRSNKYRLAFSRFTFDLLLHYVFERELQWGSVIVRIMNEHLEIKIIPGRPTRYSAEEILAEQEGISGHGESQSKEFNSQPVRLGHMPMSKDMMIDIEAELEDVQNGSADDLFGSKSALAETFQQIKREPQEDSPAVESVPLPPYQSADVKAEIEAIKDVRNRLSIDPQASMPSVCMYTFHNTYDAMNCVDISADSSMIVGGFAESYLRVWSLNKSSRPSKFGPVGSLNTHPPSRSLQRAKGRAHDEKAGGPFGARLRSQLFA